MKSEVLKKTQLYAEHIGLGAKMVPFAGWEMPVSYKPGILQEHIHTRRAAGLFDISHMGELLLRGERSQEDLHRLFTADIRALSPGKAKYGFFLNENGCFIDDLIVFKKKEREYMLVVNASRIDRDKEWISANRSDGTAIEDISCQTAKIDLQGPLSDTVMSKFISLDILESLGRFSFIEIYIEGIPVLLSRTGYTGEKGFEVFCSYDRAKEIWSIFAAEKEVRPVGLGARDTLRLEMGYPLYGSDIDENRTPVEANLMRFVDAEKNFIGKNALGRSYENRLVGFVTGSRRSARKGFKVFYGQRCIGEVTSASYAPSLETGIGLCYVSADFSEPGKELVLAEGKRKLSATIVTAPFYKSR